MKRKEVHIIEETWFYLSEAARYLGVHFTTLRRWADMGEVECIRTPGGRRRFSQRALEAFLQRKSQSQPKQLTEGEESSVDLAVHQPVHEHAVDHTRQEFQSFTHSSNSWIYRLSEEQRLQMRGTGHRLMALLLQYSSRDESSSIFLEEGKRIAGNYSDICSSVGMSLLETI